MLLQWDQIYSVNVAEIDDQHKKIFEIINAVAEAKKNGDSKFFSLIIKEMEDYSIYHFSTEEKCFVKFDYSQKDTHIKMHQFFIAEVKKIKNSKIKDVKKSAGEALEFLKNWWLDHIQREDMKYSDFFNQHGLY